MADADGGGRKWLTYGCVGCLTLVGIVVLAIGGFFGAARLGVRSEEVEDRVLTPEMPTAASAARWCCVCRQGNFA